MARAVITSKGQVTIPKAVRNLLNLKTGDIIEFAVRNGEVRLVPVAKHAEEVFGILSGKKRKSYSVEQMNRKMKKAISEHGK